MRVASAAVGAALGGALVAIALLTAGGDVLAPNTWTEIVLIAVGAAAAAGVLLVGAPGRAWGAATLLLFAALATLTAVSVTWSVQPENSWVEAGRTASYLAAFGCAIALARLVPERWSAIPGAIATASAAICAYALLAKVFPASLDAADPFGRLRAPFDYWNATGLTGALGLPACLWAGARREAHPLLRALAAPATAVLISVIVLSYSRGAVLVAVLGVLVWFATVPLRLRGALVLAVGAAGGAAIAAYALSTRALTHDLVPLAQRDDAGHRFGLVVLLALGLSLAGGLALARAVDRASAPEPLRRRIGGALVALLALVPVIAVIALAASPRGLAGEVSHLVARATNANSGAANTPGRLVELGNSRGRYWSEGLKVGEHHLINGVGALGYATAATRYTTDARVVPHAHSYVIETFADFGLVGVGVSLALLIAWALATRRTLAGATDRGVAPEREAALTLLAVVIVFGAHSSIDWTWFVPGVAVPALICAGWLAGRGPLSRPVGRVARRRLAGSPGRAAAALAICTLALGLAWAIYQPLHAANAQAAAVAAFERGDLRAAQNDAEQAAASDPVAIEPLWQLAAVYQASGDRALAASKLREAVSRQPENPQTWLALGQFYLDEGRARAALPPLVRAHELDLGSYTILAALSRAGRAASGS